MDDLSVYFFETGFQNSIPGIKQGFPAFAFPFFGEYFLLDVALYNFVALTDNIFILLDQNIYKVGLSLVDRWERKKPELLVGDESVDLFIHHLQEQKVEYVVLSSLSYVGFFESERLKEIVEGDRYSIVKLSLENTPVEVYICNRKELIKLLKRSRRGIGRKEKLADYLFENFLLTNFDIIRDIPGKLFFNNSIEQIYESNLKLINILSNSELVNFFNSMEKFITTRSDSYISSKGYVKNSFISRDVQIEGYVENSIIYPGVKISRGARVMDSVVMNGNIICRNASVIHTVVLPNTRELKPGGCNIGDSSAIGERKRGIINSKYPNQIKDGLTVIGFNADLPHGCKIEAGCVVESDVSFSRIRNFKNFKRGQTIEAERVEGS